MSEFSYLNTFFKLGLVLSLTDIQRNQNYKRLLEVTTAY